LRRHRVHCIPHPTSVTIAKRPSREGGTAEGTTNFGFSEIEIFLAPGLDNPTQLESAHEIGFLAHADFRASWLMAQGAPRKNRTDLPVVGQISDAVRSPDGAKRNPGSAGIKTGPGFRFASSGLRTGYEALITKERHRLRRTGPPSA
jgi:hypothetical protein